MTMPRWTMPVTLAVGWVLIGCGPAPAGESRDLHLNYRSDVDQSEQPYRLFVPSTYDERQAWPLVLALHGTGGDENTLFDVYRTGALLRAAEKLGVLVASPRGGPAGPTEYRGIGEHDVLAVLRDVRRQYRVDATRIYLTGHSMGGTGSAYLALHHPDVFAAAAPLAAAYSFPWLARNARPVPFLWIGGANDASFYLRGVMVGVERMLKFGAPASLELLPGEGHQGPVKDFERIFDWLLKQRRDPHPKSYVFDIDTPLHGQAFWTSAVALSTPGQMASIEGEALSKHELGLRVRNVDVLELTPDPAVFDSEAPLRVLVDGTQVWHDALAAGKTLRLARQDHGWQARLEARRTAPPGYRSHPVADAPEALDMLGTEKRLANWFTDAMRRATGAEIALYSPIYYRGLPLPQGTVDMVDIIHCSRPFNQCLVTLDLSGQDLVDILEDNLRSLDSYRAMGVDLPGAGRLVQVSGMKYAFDLRRPVGKRIVEVDLKLDRVYHVVLEGQVVERGTMLLAGRFKKLDYHTTDIPLSLALYGSAASQKRIIAPREGRVRDLSGSTP
jgi:predicted esterase